MILILQIFQTGLKCISEDRKKFVTDILKGSILTLLFVGLSVSLIYNKINKHIFSLFIIISIIIDHGLVNQNILMMIKAVNYIMIVLITIKRNLNKNNRSRSIYSENNTNGKEFIISKIHLTRQRPHISIHLSVDIMVQKLEGCKT